MSEKNATFGRFNKAVFNRWRKAVQKGDPEAMAIQPLYQSWVQLCAIPAFGDQEQAIQERIEAANLYMEATRQWEARRRNRNR